MGLLSIQSIRVFKMKLPQIYFVVSYMLAISLLLSFFVGNPLRAQSNNNGSINFNIDNEKLSSALYRLANDTEMNFSYDSSDSLFSKKISYNAVNKQPLIILEELLSNSNHNYKKVGNQIVIYRDKDSNQSLSANENYDGNLKNSNIPVAVIQQPSNFHKEPIVETTKVHDTIIKIQIDTILITDTVFIEKEKPKKLPATKIKDIPVDYFNPDASRENGWAAAIYFAPIMSDFSLAKQTDEWDIRNFSLGVEVIRIFNNWNISGGFNLTHFAEKFNHSYNITEGGYFVSDTVDEYYTVSQTDTTWYYVTDSTYKPIDNNEYSYNINNRIGYLQFTLSASFDYYSNRKLRLYIKGGLQAGVLIYSSGLAIPDANEPIGVDFADLNFNNLSYSVLAGAGIKYRINESLDFNSELYYFNNFTEVVIDYSLDRKIRGVGLKLGLIYYF